MSPRATGSSSYSNLSQAARKVDPPDLLPDSQDSLKIKPNLPESSRDLDWSNLVNTATQALHSDAVNSTTPPDIVERIEQLETELTEEKKTKDNLFNEIGRLQEENKRLTQESQSQAQQLKHFTDWFFNTIDSQSQ